LKSNSRAQKEKKIQFEKRVLLQPINPFRTVVDLQLFHLVSNNKNAILAEIEYHMEALIESKPMEWMVKIFHLSSQQRHYQHSASQEVSNTGWKILLHNSAMLNHQLRVFSN
jgi:hypothetical protein